MQGMYWKFLRNPAELVYLDTTNIPVIEEVCHQSPAAATDENVVALQADIEWTDAVQQSTQDNAVAEDCHIPSASA